MVHSIFEKGVCDSESFLSCKSSGYSCEVCAFLYIIALTLDIRTSVLFEQDTAMAKKKADTEEEKYVSTGYAAIKLGVYPNTIRKYFDRGLLTGQRLPFGRRRVSKKSLDELLRRVNSGEKFET
jgi:hypothetical protein